MLMLEWLRLLRRFRGVGVQVILLESSVGVARLARYRPASFVILVRGCEARLIAAIDFLSGASVMRMHAFDFALLDFQRALPLG